MRAKCISIVITLKSITYCNNTIALSVITSHSQKVLSMFRRTIGTALAAADKLSFPGGRSVFMISQ